MLGRRIAKVEARGRESCRAPRSKFCASVDWGHFLFSCSCAKRPARAARAARGAGAGAGAERRGALRGAGDAEPPAALPRRRAPPRRPGAMPSRAGAVRPLK